jgi:hypothetical protein
MALKARVEDQVLGGGFQITADDTVYKLQLGGCQCPARSSPVPVARA